MTFFKKKFSGSLHILLYSATMAILVFTLKWLQWEFLIRDSSTDIYFGLNAVFFTLLGVWAASQLNKPKIQTIFVEKKVYLPQLNDPAINEAGLQKLNLSNREYEILNFLEMGFSNAEIAEQLSLAISTVKTHVSNLYVKMQVRSRTQAIAKAKRLRIIP